MELVEPIRKFNSKYDIVVKGNMFRFIIEPTDNGRIIAAYYQEIKNFLPPQLMPIYKFAVKIADDGAILRGVDFKEFKRRWWESEYFFRKRIENWAASKRKSYEDIVKADVDAEKIRKMLG